MEAAVAFGSLHGVVPSLLPFTRSLRRLISAADCACIAGLHSTGKDAQPKHLVFGQTASRMPPKNQDNILF
eukprot:5916300-Prymnesium_polylepis.1